MYNVQFVINDNCMACNEVKVLCNDKKVCNKNKKIKRKIFNLFVCFFFVVKDLKILS